MEKRKMRRKPGFARRMLVTMLSLVLLFGTLSPGLLASADETVTDPPTQVSPEQTTEGQETTTVTETEEPSFLDSFNDAVDQQTLSGTQTGAEALAFIAKYNLLRDQIQALDPTADDYTAQVEALNVQIAALNAQVELAELSESDRAEVTAAAVGAVTPAGSDQITGEPQLKEQTVTAYVDEKTFAVTGNLPEGVEVSVQKLEDEVLSYIRTDILGLDALPAGYTNAAYDVKLLLDGVEIQPDDTVTLAVSSTEITENSDVSVYHLPGSSEDSVYAGYNAASGISMFSRMIGGELTGEKIEQVNVYDGYYAFFTDGFSVYYVVAGTSDDGSQYDTTIRDLPSENSTYYVEAGTIISFNNANSNWTNVTTVDGITRNNGTITISRDAKLGATAVYRRGNVTLTFIVSERTEIIENAISTQPVYLAIRLETNLPGEPGVTDGDYKRLNSAYVANSGWAWEEYTFSDTASGIISPSITETVYVTPDGSSTVGVYDATGAVCMNYIISGSIDWDRMLDVAIAQRAEATDGTTVTQSNRNNYEVIPYVVKYMVERGIGWHIDCIVVPKDRITLSYDLNLKNYVVPENTLTLPDAVVQTTRPLESTVGSIKKDSSNLKIGDTIQATLDGKEYTLTFKGWSLNDPNGNPTHNPNDNISVNVDSVLYAIWEGKPNTGDLTITKTFVGFDDKDTERPEITVVVTDPDGKDDTITLNADNKWTKTLEGVDIGTYTIQENSPVSGSVFKGESNKYSYKLTAVNYSDTSFEVISGQTTSATITNTYEKQAGTLTVTKQFNGLPDDVAKPAISISVSGPVTAAATLNSENNWTWSESDLPVGEYTVTETAPAATVADGKYEYVDTEVKVGESDSVKSLSATATVANGETATVAYTNNYELKYTTITLDKIVDGNMADQNRNFKFTVTVDGKELETKYTLNHNTPVATIENIPIGSTVTIKESDNEGYDVSATVDGSEATVKESVLTIDKVSADGHTVVFTNYNNVTIDTGLEMDSFPFIMMLSSVIVMAAFFLIGRKRMMF